MMPQTNERPRIGFIGQGYIGKNYANDFERRGYAVVRYSLEPAYAGNKEQIRDCDIVFIAVPTPTTPEGFDSSIVEEALSCVGEGKIAVIKSTVLPGTTERLQSEHPALIILMSPEFLTEATAARDAAHPNRTIIGVASDDAAHREAAEHVLSILPHAPFSQICRSREAEYIKYGGNIWFYFKILFVNALYDLAEHDGCDYAVIRNAMAADSRIGSSHLLPVHASGTVGGDDYQTATGRDTQMVKGGRGAGGHCFIKDFAAFTRLYRDTLPDDALGISMLEAIEVKNIELLTKSGKDVALLRGVYGNRI
ncbi:hypothetical protein KGM48_03480 [Patescibacteria group bacterium]|nr:hypothetical protein [Patescibacteria group bacterium]